MKNNYYIQHAILVIFLFFITACQSREQLLSENATLVAGQIYGTQTAFVPLETKIAARIYGTLTASAPKVTQTPTNRVSSSECTTESSLVEFTNKTDFYIDMKLYIPEKRSIKLSPHTVTRYCFAPTAIRYSMSVAGNQLSITPMTFPYTQFPKFEKGCYTWAFAGSTKTNQITSRIKGSLCSNVTSFKPLPYW